MGQPRASSCHCGLAEADAAVVARHAAVREHPEALVRQPVHDPMSQEQVLEHAAGQRHHLEAGLLAQPGADGHDRSGDAVVEPRRDDRDGHACAKVLGGGPDQVRASHSQLAVARR